MNNPDLTLMILNRKCTAEIILFKLTKSRVCYYVSIFVCYNLWFCVIFCSLLYNLKNNKVKWIFFSDNFGKCYKMTILITININKTYS